MSTASERYVLLRGGLSVPIEPLLLLLDLESRGFQLTVDDDGGIVIIPGSRLTDEDRRLVRGWKPHLIALLNYEAPGQVQ
jgi:hypothetical protein